LGSILYVFFKLLLSSNFQEYLYQLHGAGVQVSIGQITSCDAKDSGINKKLEAMSRSPYFSMVSLFFASVLQLDDDFYLHRELDIFHNQRFV
jgi:hypothetical protein